jgi:hypothetical protein
MVRVLTLFVPFLSSSVLDTTDVHTSANELDRALAHVRTFIALYLLHACLVRRGAAACKEVWFVKWVCLAYAAALRARRGAVLRGGGIDILARFFLQPVVHHGVVKHREHAQY